MDTVAIIKDNRTFIPIRYLAEAMKLIKIHHPTKVIGLLTPGDQYPSKELMQYAKFKAKIRTGPLSASQLPNPIPGTNIKKPFIW